MKDSNKTAAIYIRISTKDQEEGYSQDFQLDQCREALEKDGLLFNKEYVFSDTASGANDNRPQWQNFIAKAKAGEIKYVYFWKLDRMMRSEYYYFVNAKVLEDLGVQMRFATQDLKDPFHLAIQVAVTAEEKRRILERTKNGRERAIRDGKWAWGLPPFGYKLRKVDGRKWPVIDQEKAVYVTKIFEWIAYERCSLKEVCRRLNEKKVPTWTQSTKTKRKVSSTWWPRTVGRILVNEIYTGKTHFNKFKRGKIDLHTVRDKNRMRPENEWLEVSVPPIITKELYESAYNQLRKNSDFASRKKIRSYMFSGLLFCNKCGFRLRSQYHKPTSSTAEGSRSYFSFMTERYEEGSNKCKYCGCIAESRLMPIWDLIKRILSNPDSMYGSLKRYSKDSKIEKSQEKAANIESELKSLNDDERRLKVAFFEAKSIDDDEYMSKVRRLKSRRETLQSQKNQVRSLIVNEEERARRVDTIGKLHSKLMESIENASYETMDEIVHLLVERIDLKLEENSAEVEFNFTDSFLQEHSRC